MLSLLIVADVTTHIASMENFPKSAFGILRKAFLSFENEALPVEKKIPFAVIILSRIYNENLTKFAQPLLSN